MIESKFDFKHHKICFDPNIKNTTYIETGMKLYYSVYDLEVINVINGIQCKDMNGVLQFLLLPRHYRWC